jgi:hypothetical protein
MMKQDSRLSSQPDEKQGIAIVKMMDGYLLPYDHLQE